MALGDNVHNAAQDLSGNAEEDAGEATDDEQLQGGGQGDQAEASAKKAGEDVEDVLE